MAWKNLAVCITGDFFSLWPFLCQKSQDEWCRGRLRVKQNCLDFVLIPLLWLCKSSIIFRARYFDCRDNFTWEKSHHLVAKKVFQPDINYHLRVAAVRIELRKGNPRKGSYFESVHDSFTRAHHKASYNGCAVLIQYCNNNYLLGRAFYLAKSVRK